jgi:iron(II)-dependent oxidoreductase
MSEAPKEFWRRRVHSFYSPIGWHFGHIGRTEEFWVCKATHREPLDPGLSFVYADLAENPKDNRVNIPEVEATLSYLERTREVALEALKASNLNLDDPFLKEGYAWEFAIQHECQHQETIAEMLCLIQKQTTLTSVAPIPWESKLVTKTIAHPSGEFLMGSDNVYGYDNEKNPHRVKVSGFGLGNYPVTAFQWSEFILEGGYQRSEIWSPEGWHWRQENHVTVPFYWTIDQGYFQIGPFGLRALHPDEPVQGISQFEAEAYARWKKMRLPSEEEWEFAASSAPDGIKRKFPWGDSEPTPASAAHSLRGWAPQPVGSVDRGKTPLGVSDMAGNIWEWTSGKFLPYPGFSAFPYDGYSKDHMEGKHFVCRGGSWATSPTILRNTFRNWYVPSYRQGFLGVRLATD